MARGPKTAKGPRKSPRNAALAPGIPSRGRSASYKKQGKWAVKNKKAKAAKPEVAKPVVKKITGSKNGDSRTIAVKEPRFYPADDEKKPIANRKRAGTTTLRGSIQPGSVLILLAGRFRGKRVVFLKQLESGLLLVTGPYKINGVPLRRVNQAYVIATKTTLDISKVKVDAKFGDDYFKRPAKAASKKSESEFFNEESEKTEISADRIADQKAVDAAVLEAVKKTPTMKEYLNAKFSLTRGQYPHQMQF